MTTGSDVQERELLGGRARAATRTPSGAWSSLAAASCTRTATGCSGRCTTPRTRCRRRCCASWKGMARFEGRSSLRSWLYRIATNTCLDSIGRRPKRVLPVDYGPAADPHGGPGEPVVETGLDRAASRRAARARGRARGPGGALRAARGGGARVHRRAAAPAGQSARRADPARGARLQRQGGRRDPGDDDGVGEQRSAARPQDGGRPASGAEPAADAPRARRRRAARARRRATSRHGSAGTSMPWSGC